jgi:hypothetical protein
MKIRVGSERDTLEEKKAVIFSRIFMFACDVSVVLWLMA